RPRNTQVSRGWFAVQDALLFQASVEAGIEVASRGAAGAVANGAIGIEIGADPQFCRRGRVIQPREARECGKLVVSQGRIGKALAVERAELILAPLRPRAAHLAIELPRIQLEDEPAYHRVEHEAILRARRKPV